MSSIYQNCRTDLTFLNSMENLERSVDLNAYTDDQCRSFEVLHLDEIHPQINGNKPFKLLGYLEGLELGSKLLSVGGIHSNHLYAFASLNTMFELHAVIRRPFVATKSPTIDYLIDCGVTIHWVDSTEYKLRYDRDWIDKYMAELDIDQFIPEGGNGPQAEVGLKCLAELINTKLNTPAELHLAAGTGVTAAYLSKHLAKHIKLKVTPVVTPNQFKQPMLSPEVLVWRSPRLRFGKLTPWARRNIDRWRNSGLSLDQVYTINALENLLKSSAERRVLLHTGGLRV